MSSFICARWKLMKLHKHTHKHIHTCMRVCVCMCVCVCVCVCVYVCVCMCVCVCVLKCPRVGTLIPLYKWNLQWVHCLQCIMWVLWSYTSHERTSLFNHFFSSFVLWWSEDKKSCGNVGPRKHLSSGNFGFSEFTSRYRGKLLTFI